MPRCLAAVLCTLAIACGGGSPGSTSCQHDFDCPAGQGCVSGSCAALPCGGCQPDQACSDSGQCIAAQGATCVTNTCPAGYPCNSASYCAKPCLLNTDCDTGFVCNDQFKSCAECSFDTDCAAVTGRTRCDPDNGVCVACNTDFDCTQSLGTDHYCNAHVCSPGCASNDDCNAGAGETCDLSTTPGKCVQCHTDDDCQAAFGASAGACDDTNHCVQCFGATQAAASAAHCAGTATPECNLTATSATYKHCVACITDNNASGADCGYALSSTTKDPHNATTCNPANNSCIDGCATDVQCGCPRNGPNGTESACPRFPDQEHCDPARTTEAGVTGATVGACVQCTSDDHCAYKVNGTDLDSGTYASQDGSYCKGDVCTEGCSVDQDCWPSIGGVRNPNGKICNIGGGSLIDHKCVECTCTTPSADGTYCEGAGQTGCTGSKVCDSSTLECRLKREGETCTANTDCGDNSDPALNGCIGTGAACILTAETGAVGATTVYCSASHTTGKCGVPCDDLQDNQCNSGAGFPCPSGSTCGTDPSVGHFCIPNACDFQ